MSCSPPSPSSAPSTMRPPAAVEVATVIDADLIEQVRASRAAAGLPLRATPAEAARAMAAVRPLARRAGAGRSRLAGDPGAAARQADAA